MWTKAGSVTKCLRIQTNPDTCGQGLSYTQTAAVSSKSAVVIFTLRSREAVDIIMIHSIAAALRASKSGNHSPQQVYFLKAL